MSKISVLRLPTLIKVVHKQVCLYVCGCRCVYPSKAIASRYYVLDRLR